MPRDYSRAEILDIIEREAQERNIPRDDFMRFAYIETGGTFDETVNRGPSGAKGLFQFVPSTARQYGIAGRELDPVANTDAAARLYLDNQRALVRRHERDGLPYLSGKPGPDGLDMYIAHQQGAAGYASIQAAIAAGGFSRDDTRAKILNNVSARDIREVAGVSMDQFRAMSDRDMAATFVHYWDTKFDRIRIPEKGIEPVVDGQLRESRAEQRQSLQADAVPAPGLALAAAHAMAIRYDDVGYKMGGKNPDSGVVDCSGWVVALQNATMAEINEKAGRAVFGREDRFSPGWDGSGAIVQKAAQRAGVLLEGSQVNASNLKEGMVIGLDTGPAAHDKWKGIDHVAMVVRDPGTGALMVTESKGGKSERGVRMLPVDEFLHQYRNAKLFAADPLAKARELLQEQQQVIGAREDGVPAHGQRGPGVKALQEDLKALGIRANDGTLLAGTGYYGDKTREVLANFQRQHGLEPTGAADRATLDAIAGRLAASRGADGAGPQRTGGAPLLSDSAHPNHALFAEVARRIGEQTGHAPKPEAAANVALQMLENGIRSPGEIRALAVSGSDVHVQGSTPGARVSVDLRAPTASLAEMSEHMARQTREREAQERQPQLSPGTVLA